jgi:asparagine synthase (glutamine-hydrolysing)
VEYVYNVPWDYKCPNGVVKGLLRDSAKGLLPDEILYRKKSPYPKTYSPVYEKILAKNVMKILEDKKSAVNDIFEKDKIIELINQPKDYGKPWFGQLMGSVQMLAYIVQIDYWTKKFDITL